MLNLHKYYYKDYFKNINFNYLLLEEEIKKEKNDDRKRELIKKLEEINSENERVIKKNNKTLTGDSFSNKDHIPFIINNPIAKDEIENLVIAYPGLVTGVGINHEAKIEGEFKLGVHFDYTWGMPVVYGSSVKGVLKAYFKEIYKIFYKNDAIDLIDLEHDIFCGEVRNKDLEQKIYKEKYGDEWKEKWAKGVQFEKNRKYTPKSIYNRDIFFDAVITVADNDGRILCSDSITPHGDNPLKNPVPLTFMKIAAGCTMEFRFKLVDSKIDGNYFKAEHKKALFKEILETVGVGAKTNVGYGQFQQIKTKK